MGAKTRLADAIREAVDRAAPRAESVLDLMSGTAVVAQTLAAHHRVVANDVQAYAAAIARAYLVHTDPARLAVALDPERDLGAAYRENFAALHERFADAVALEDAFVEAHGLSPEEPDAQAGPWWVAPSDPARLARARRALPARAARADAYRAFALRDTPAFLETADAEVSGAFRAAAPLFRREAVRARRADPTTRPYLLASVYYPNVYFGVRQALQVDSLRCAIDALGRARDPLAREKRDHYLGALLHAVSVTTSATSHFCQPRGLTSPAEVKAVLVRRALSIPSRLVAYSREIAATCAATRYHPGNHVLSADWRQVLGPRWDEVGAQVVYADPPYTADHYSRFYHVLEVLTRYDHPVLKTSRGRPTKGRYPALDARHQSAFCVRRLVERELSDLFQAAAGRGAALVLSYAEENGLALRAWREAGCTPAEALRRLERLAADAYGDVALTKRPLLHSGQGDSNHTVTELLLVARRPRSARARSRRGAGDPAGSSRGAPACA